MSTDSLQYLASYLGMKTSPLAKLLQKADQLSITSATFEQSSPGRFQLAADPIHPKVPWIKVVRWAHGRGLWQIYFQLGDPIREGAGRFTRLASAPGREGWSLSECAVVLLGLMSSWPMLLRTIHPHDGCVHVFHTAECHHPSSRKLYRSLRTWKQALQAPTRKK